MVEEIIRMRVIMKRIATRLMHRQVMDAFAAW